MSSATNLTNEIREHLPSGLIHFMQAASRVAEKNKQKIYLVGGVVRDLLLERSNLDLDLVVEGDAISLAQELALTGTSRGEITTHQRFGTAKLKFDEWSVDIITARAETYSKPGALPSVRFSNIKDDLARRDFTINAMAIDLSADHFGELLDPHGGVADLEQRQIRILHKQSFIDDATRIWRALRYEQRLDFQLEPATLVLLKRDTAMLDTISGDRIRHELEHVLKEALPEKVLLRADELGVLGKLQPSLKGDDWLAAKFARAREVTLVEPMPESLYLALMAYRLTSDESGRLVAYLKLSKAAARVVQDILAVKGKINDLSISGAAPSHIFSLLHGYDTKALTASSVATEGTVVAEHIDLYLNVLRLVKPALTGNDLKKMGIPQGPKINEILEKLREARLDGQVDTKKDEEEIARARFLS
jgi:tRNA nucleotidyltransferase (CCA-adding enzyme)